MTTVEAAEERAGDTPRAVDERVQRGLFIAGCVLLPLGLAVIALGWYGAAHSPYPFQQTPYLISGGLLGVGLVLAGGFLYFGHWLARMAASTRHDTELLLAALARVTPAAAEPTRDVRVPAQRLVVTPTGSMVHRPDCPIVASRDDVREAPAGADLRPCRVCDPL